MTCRKFRKELHHLLDIREAEHLTNDMTEHLKSCESCRTFAQAMKKLDFDLRHLPDIEVPADLEATLQAIPRVCEKENLLHPVRDDLRRMATYLVPGAALAIVAFTLLPEAHVIFSSAIAALAFVAIVLQYKRWSSRTS